MERSIKYVPALVGAGSSASFALSVVYDLGYFSVVGPRYFLFMTLSDHVNSLLPWLPSTALAACLLFLFWQVLIRGRELDAPTPTSPRMSDGFLGWIGYQVRFLGSFLVTAVGLLFFILLLRVSVFIAANVGEVPSESARLSSDGIFIAFSAAASFVASALMMTSSPRQWLQSQVSKFDPALVLVVMSALLLAGCYFLGRGVAIDDMTRPVGMYELRAQMGPEQVACGSCKVLRSYSNGLLVFDADLHQVSFVKIDAVISVSREVSDLDGKQTLFGWIFDVGRHLFQMRGR